MPTLTMSAPGQDQLLRHLAGDDVARHDHEVRIALAHLRDELDEALGIAVGDVDAHVAYRRVRVGTGLAHHLVELLLVGARDAHRVERGRLALQRPEERHALVDPVVLVQRGREPVGLERAGHLERADRVHVGGDDRRAVVLDAGVPEAELARDVDVRARGERAPLGTDQHVLEVELDLGLDAHRALPFIARQKRRPVPRVRRCPILPAMPARAYAGQPRRGFPRGRRPRDNGTG